MPDFIYLRSTLISNNQAKGKIKARITAARNAPFVLSSGDI